MMTRLLKITLALGLGLIILGFGLINLTNAAPLTQIPLAQNPYPECPPNDTNIWVKVDTNMFVTGEATLQLPLESGEIVDNGNTYVNYLLGVLLAEAGPDDDFRPVDDETLKTMAILARTVTYKNCGCELTGGNGDCSMSLLTDTTNIRQGV